MSIASQIKDHNNVLSLTAQKYIEIHTRLFCLESSCICRSRFSVCIILRVSTRLVFSLISSVILSFFFLILSYKIIKNLSFIQQLSRAAEKIIIIICCGHRKQNTSDNIMFVKYCLFHNGKLADL